MPSDLRRVTRPIVPDVGAGRHATWHIGHAERTASSLRSVSSADVITDPLARPLTLKSSSGSRVSVEEDPGVRQKVGEAPPSPSLLSGDPSPPWALHRYSRPGWGPQGAALIAFHVLLFLLPSLPSGVGGAITGRFLPGEKGHAKHLLPSILASRASQSSPKVTTSFLFEETRYKVPVLPPSPVT